MNAQTLFEVAHELECRVPCASIRAAETAAKRVGVAESGVDDGGVRDAEHELLEPDTRQALVLSERTIAKHIENILSKLGFESRAQVAVWAAARRLEPPGPKRDV